MQSNFGRNYNSRIPTVIWNRPWVNSFGIPTVEDEEYEKCFVRKNEVTTKDVNGCINMTTKAGTSVNFTLLAGNHNVYW